MAKNIEIDFDNVRQHLDKLTSVVKESLARRIAVAGGRTIRDEARVRAPKGVAEAQTVRQYGGSKNPGLLEDSIYVAYNKALSGKDQQAYSVRWNHKLAPHGWLAEFGYWQRYEIAFDSKRQEWFTKKDREGNLILKGSPKKIPGAFFMTASWEAKAKDAGIAGIEAGRLALPFLMQGGDDNVDA